MIGMNSFERWIKNLEERVADLGRRLVSALHRIDQVAEDAARQADSAAGGGKVPKFASTITPVTARFGDVLGSGTVHLLIVSADPVDGTRTYDSTGIEETVYHAGLAEIGVGELVQLKVIDGDYWVDVRYCA